MGSLAASLARRMATDERPREPHEHFFNPRSSFCAGFKSWPTVFRHPFVLHLPLIAQIGLIYNQNEWQWTQRLCDALLQFDRFFKRRSATAVGHQDVSGRAT